MSAGCENCAELVEQNQALQERIVQSFEKCDALTDELADSQRQKAALKGQLTRLRQDGPEAKDAEECFAFWVERLGKNVRTTFGPARRAAVNARLKEPSLTGDGERKDDVKRGIVGLALLPYVSDTGRHSIPGEGRTRKDDLELVCRTESHLDRFIGYADAHDQHGLEWAAAALRARFGDLAYASRDPLVPGDPIELITAPCLVCKTTAALVIVPGPLGLRFGCAKGCDGEAIREKVRKLAAPRLVAA